MFGYITIYKPELKVKDYYKYRAYYCGLCKTLKEQFGLSGQLTLSYDMTFVIILLTSLYEADTRRSAHTCMVHPIKKQDILQNEISEYCAQMNLILSYYHFVDDWEDERSIAGIAGSKILKKKIKKIIAQYPVKCKRIKSCLKQLHKYEKENVTDLDTVAGSFGHLMGELFVIKKDQWSGHLRRMGYFLGKFIYLMDAYDDVDSDMEKGSYNPLIKIKGAADYESRCQEILNMMMAECSNEFEKLPCLLDADILRNILYVGVWSKYDKIQEELKEGKVRKDGK